MKRKIYNELERWKNQKHGSEALLLDGARRIGKSYIVEEFAKNEYRSYILIDFNIAGEEIRELFDLYLHDLKNFFSRLQLLTGKRLYERESLIIFDEVQLCPRARAAIKYLVADGRYDYIETGSLMSINHNVKDILIPSEEHRLDMYPMDFEEFLWAMGDELSMDYIRECYAERKPLGNAIHRKMMDYMRAYMIVGGMPQAVLQYAQNGDFEAVNDIQRNILKLYRNDIQKYANRHKEKVTRIFDAIPAQLQRHEKKFRLATMEKGARMRNYETAFFWLDESRVANTCYCVCAPNVALTLMKGDRFKLYMGDTGLLMAMTFEDKNLIRQVYQKLLKGKLEMNKGMLVENLVAQMLKSAGKPLYFYSNSSTKNEDKMEIDFLLSKPTITNRHNIIPIEVKSATRFSTTSLDKCRKKFAEQILQPIVLYPGDVQTKDQVLYLPLYMASIL